MSRQGRFRVRQTLLHTISVDLLGELSRIRFFSFFNCFAIFVTISVFLFIFWFVYCWFLFRYWRHWPIHVESELIKHLSRFSSSSFSEFLYQKMVLSRLNDSDPTEWPSYDSCSKWPRVPESLLGKISKVLTEVFTARVTQSSHTETTRACQITKNDGKEPHK